MATPDDDFRLRHVAAALALGFVVFLRRLVVRRPQGAASSREPADRDPTGGPG